MSTTLTVNGSAVTLSTLNSWPRVLTYRFGGYSTLEIERRGGALPAVSDGWLGKTVVLAIGGTTYFTGDIVSREPVYTEIGWVTSYQCTDLKARCDRVPFTDDNTLTDTAAYNLMSDDPQSVASRQGRTVGQILSDVLTMLANSAALDARGVGGYTGMPATPTLPADTLSDLSALTVIPPAGCFVQGEKLICAIEQFLRQWAPNYVMWIAPSGGHFRFYDQRTFSDNTLTLGTDPVEVSVPRRSVQDCFQRVVVRGQPVAERMVVSTLDGTLAEDFGYTDVTGTVTNAAAKAAWTPAQAALDKSARSEGTASCTSTTTVDLHATDATQVWDTDDWDQTSTGHKGQIDLFYTAGSGLTMLQSRRIVANVAHTAGSTTQVTLDLPLPSTNYDKYKLYGVSNGLGMTWRRYSVVNTTIGHAMARQLTYPAPWVGANGDIAVMTSYPMGSVCWSASGTAPFEERPDWFTMDPTNSKIYFLTPTYIAAGNKVPSDVRALLAVNTGELTATYPADTAGPTKVYGGTSNSVEGLTETLTVTVLQWRDSASSAGMLDYAHDLYDSVKDTVVEGTVVYHGYYGTALTPGNAISIAGNGYTTGYESLALPIREVQLHWNLKEATKFRTVMQVSNRRSHYTAAAFLRPERMIGGQQINYEGFTDTFAFGGAYEHALGAVGAAADKSWNSRSANTAGVGDSGVSSGANPLGQYADPTSVGQNPTSAAVDPTSPIVAPEMQ